LIEVKNPWLITSQGINEVLNGLALSSAILITCSAPVEGEYAGHLAVEQLYGYMVHNGKTLGTLTTMKGWCLIRRFNGGMLQMTPIYSDFPAWGNIITDAAEEGYNPTPNFSIPKALYYSLISLLSPMIHWRHRPMVDAQSRIDGENQGVKYLLSEIQRGVKDHMNGGTL